MKKLLPLLFLVACADPNAELLAKYKNLEIDHKALELQLKTTQKDYEQWMYANRKQLESCQTDLKQFVCVKINRKTLEYRVLCDGPIIVDLPSDEE